MANKRILKSNGLIKQNGKIERDHYVNYTTVTLPIKFSESNYNIISTVNRNSAQNNATSVYIINEQSFKFFCNDVCYINYTTEGY